MRRFFSLDVSWFIFNDSVTHHFMNNTKNRVKYWI